MKIYSIKFWKLITIIIVAYIMGICIGFGWCATTPKVNAAPITNEMQLGGDPLYKRMYVNGRYYIVFWNNCGLSAVREN